MVLDELVDHGDEPMSMRDMRMLADIDVEVTVEFGRARLELRDLLSLRRGSLVELSRGLDQPVGILANNTLVAYGEVVMVGDRFGVHVLEIVDPSDRGKPQRLERTTPAVAVEHQWAEAPAPQPTAATVAEPAPSVEPAAAGRACGPVRSRVGLIAGGPVRDPRQDRGRLRAAVRDACGC
jgi:flagellar motor switch protein FliN